MNPYHNFPPWRSSTLCLPAAKVEFSCCLPKESGDRCLQVSLVRIQPKLVFCLTVFEAFFEAQAVFLAVAPLHKPCWSLAFWVIVEVVDDDSVVELDTVQTFKIHLMSRILVGTESDVEADDCKDHFS